MEKNELLSVDNLTVEFDNHKIIDKVSFSVGKNETLAVIGPNGAGKSVLFRALLGLIPYEVNIKWARNKTDFPAPLGPITARVCKEK